MNDSIVYIRLGPWSHLTIVRRIMSLSLSRLIVGFQVFFWVVWLKTEDQAKDHLLVGVCGFL